MKLNLKAPRLAHVFICWTTFFCFGFTVTLGQPPAGENTPLDSAESLKKSFNEALTTKLLEVWYPKAIDEEYGGFYSSFAYDWKLLGSQNKMIVTQARHVWATAKAAKLFPENTVYRKAAAHGFQFLKNKMWDVENGGFYNLVDQQGVLIEWK